MKEKSLAQTLVDTLTKDNKRKDIIIIILICVIVLITGIFVWYISQFDYSNNTATIDTNNSGTITTGDINNG